tara:strand:+ start:48 stop:398 length:351 start_codon:yes stop_codon:yes gene_type:complete
MPTGPLKYDNEQFGLTDVVRSRQYILLSSRVHPETLSLRLQNGKLIIKSQYEYIEDEYGNRISWNLTPPGGIASLQTVFESYKDQMLEVTYARNEFNYEEVPVYSDSEDSEGWVSS